MPRYTATFKGRNGTQLNSNPQNQSCFFYTDTDAHAEAIAERIASVSNGTLTSLTKQINDYNNPQPPYGDLTDHGGSNRTRVSFSNPATRVFEQITIPFKRKDVSEEIIEGIFEDMTLQARTGADIGDVVKVELIQRVDGGRAAQPAMPAGNEPAGP